MSTVLPLATVIGAGIVYHLVQRSSSAASPWTTLGVAYGAAFALTFLFAFSGRVDAARWSPGRG